MIALSEGVDKHLIVHRTTNQVLGLLIVAGGIVLLVLVFLLAYHLFQSINGSMFEAHPALQQPHVPGTPLGHALPPGTVTARPNVGLPPATAVMVLVAKLLALVVMGWLAGLLASKGAALATGLPHRH